MHCIASTQAPTYKGCTVFCLPGADDILQLYEAASNYRLAVCSDVPTKEFILSINNEKEKSDRFVLEDLDDKHLFVQPTVIESLELRLKEFQDENTYQPPRRED